MGFFEAVVNRGGLMRAVIPKEMEASPFELEKITNDLYFAYPGIPTPEAAGGEHGSAAVDAAAVSFDVARGVWSISDTSYDTAGAMHTANEMLWMFGFVSGYPAVPGGEMETQAPAAEVGRVIEIVSSEFAFDPVDLTLPAGNEVTLRLRNDGAILHNIEIPDLGVFIQARPGETVEATFTVPNGGADFEFFCNIPGHREAGMEGQAHLDG